MRHLEEHEQLRDGALQHLPHQRSGREGRRKWQRHGPTGLCKSVISGTRDLGGSILPPTLYLLRLPVTGYRGCPDGGEPGRLRLSKIIDLQLCNNCYCNIDYGRPAL